MSRSIEHVSFGDPDEQMRRRRAEVSFAEQVRSKSILQTAAALVYLVDQQNRFVQVNRRFEEFMGRCAADLLGRSIFEFFPPEVAEVFADNNREVLLAGEPMEFEERFPRADGPHVYASVKAPLYDDAGHVLGVVGVSAEITQRKREEEELRRQRDFTQVILDTVASLVVVLDTDGRIVRFNRTCERVTGFGADEVGGRSLWDVLLLPEESAGVRRMFEELAAGRFPAQYENHFRTKDGGKRLIAWANSAIVSAEGRVEYVIGTGQDVTELRQMQAALAREQAGADTERARLQAVLDVLPVGVFIADASGRILASNRAVQAIWGGTMPLSSNPEEYGRDYAAWWPDGRPVAASEWGLARAVQTGETCVAEEVVIAARDGTRKTILNYALPIRDGERIAGAVAINVDISARKRAEEALRASEERLHLAAEGAQVGLWSWDLQDRELRTTGIANRLLGFPEDYRPTVEDVRERVLAEDHEAICAAFREAEQSGRELRTEFRVRRPDGSVRWIASIGSVHMLKGRAAQISGVWLDITERRQLEQQRHELLEAERAARSEAERQGYLKDEFLATLSHELRTPLNAILGWAQLLRRSRLDPPELAEALEVIETNARTQKELIEELLDTSRIVSGKLSLELRPVQLAKIAADACASVLPAAQAREVALVEDIAAQPPPVLGDARRVHQILWNLLSNAVKFTGRGGSVRLEVRPAGDSVRVVVRDTGVGIAPDFLPRLFQRFCQADASTTRRQRGLGLGLAIVKELTELHGGSVRAESPGQGQGSTFTVDLPVYRGPQEPASAARAQAVPATPEAGRDLRLKGRQVLVVEDERSALELVMRLLRGWEMQARGVATAAAALADIEASPPDLLISDIGMPGEDGYSLIRRIRAHPEPRIARIPAVALTAFARPEDRERALAAGFQEHLAKPIDAGALLRTLAELA